MKAPDGGWRAFAFQAAKFCLVGLLNSGVTFVSFFVLFRILGLPEYASNAASYVLGLINSFVFNKLWTFRSRGFRLAELGLFIIVFLVSYGVQLAAYRGLRLLGLTPEAAQLIAMAAYTALGFAGNKLITFRKGEPHA